jgi:hypothetical protein
MRLLVRASGLEHLHRSALHGHARPAVEGARGAAQAVDHRARPHRPAEPPARVAEALRQAVDEHDRIVVDVLDVRRGRQRARSRALAVVDEVRVELVQHEREPARARELHVRGQLLPAHDRPGRIARVRQQERVEVVALDLLAEPCRRDREAVGLARDDRVRREAIAVRSSGVPSTGP